MADVGSANIDITADDSQAQSTFSRFMGSFRRIGSLAAGIAGGFALFETAKNTFAGVAEATIGANANMETYRGTLATVLGSWEKADQSLAWVTDFAAQTPFEIPELVEATTRLETYGIAAKNSLGTIGDMAAITGKPLMQAVEAISDAQTGELERLKEFGITKQMLADQAAKMGNKELVNAKGQITDMQLLNEALFAIMEERYSGGMEIQSKTFKGMVSNARDAMGQIAMELSKPVFEGLKRGLAALLPIMDGFKAYVTGDWLGGRDIFSNLFSPETALKIENAIIAVQYAFHELKEMVVELQPAFLNLWETAKNLSPIFKDVAGAIFAGFLGLMEVLPPILEQITSILEAFTGWEGFIPTLSGIVAGLSSYQGIMAAVTKAQEIYNAIVAFSATVQTAWTAATAASAAAGGGLRGALVGLRAAFAALNLTVLANPFVLAAAALIGLGVALVQAYRHSETFRNIVNQAWTAIKQGFTATINWFTTTLPAWVASVVSWFQNLADQGRAKFQQFWAVVTQIWSQITATVSNLVAQFVSIIVAKYNSFVSVVMSVIRPLINFWVETFNNIKLFVLGVVGVFISLLTGDFEGLKLALYAIVESIRRQMQNIWTTIKTVVSNLASALVDFLKSRWEFLKTTTINIATALKNGFVNAWQALKDAAIRLAIEMVKNITQWFLNLKNDTSRKIDETKSKIVNGFQNAKDQAVEKVRSMVSAIGTWVQEAPKKFGEMISDIYAKLRAVDLSEIGKDIVQGLINGIGSMVSAVADKAAEIGDNVKGAIERVLQRKSPSRVTMAIGVDVVKGLLIGMDDLIGKVQDTSAKVAKAAIPTVQAASMPNVQGFGQNQTLFGSLREMGSRLANVVTNPAATTAGGPYVFQVNLNGRKVAEETFEDIAELQRRAEARARRARGEVR